MAKKKKTIRRTTKTDADEFAKSQNDSDEVVHVNKNACSIEFSRNAKELPSWTIKLYAERGGMGEVLTEIFSIDRSLRDHG